MKILKSFNEFKLNKLIFIIVVILYYSNNYVFKNYTTGNLNYIFKNHFNDFLGGILFMSYLNIILYTNKILIKNYLLSIFIMFLAGLFWEFGAIYLKPTLTSDWIDVFCYIFGGIIYIFLIRHIKLRGDIDVRNKKYKEII